MLFVVFRYLDAIIPREFGVTKHPLFPIKALIRYINKKRFPAESDEEEQSLFFSNNDDDAVSLIKSSILLSDGNALDVEDTSSSFLVLSSVLQGGVDTGSSGSAQCAASFTTDLFALNSSCVVPM